MISMYKFQNIRNLHKDGKSKSEIARIVGIDRATVRKYLQTNSPPTYATRKKPSRIDPINSFMDQIEDIYSRPIDGKEKEYPSACSVFRHLKRQGYSGSLRTLERRISQLKAQWPKERYFEQKYRPGEQVQLDFKEDIKFMLGGEEVILHFLVAKLPFSGRYFVKAFPNKTLQAYADGIHSAFEAFGGVPREVRIDNLSAAVKKVLKGNQRLYTDGFQKIVDYYGFEVSPCRPGQGSDKGGVERQIRSFMGYLKDTLILEKLSFSDFHDFNEWLCQFCLKEEDSASLDKFNMEQKTFAALPARDEDILCKVNISSVSKYGLARFDDMSLSVPDHAVGEDVKVVTSAYEHRVYKVRGHKQLLCKYKRRGSRENSIELEHVLPALIRKPQAMVRWAHRHLLFPCETFRNYYQYLKKMESYRAEQSYLKSLQMLFNTEMSEVKSAMELVLDSKSREPYNDFSALFLLPKSSQGRFPKQPPLTSELEKYDHLIPNL